MVSGMVRVIVCVVLFRMALRYCGSSAATICCFRDFSTLWTSWKERSVSLCCSLRTVDIGPVVPAAMASGPGWTGLTNGAVDMSAY